MFMQCSHSTQNTYDDISWVAWNGFPQFDCSSDGQILSHRINQLVGKVWTALQTLKIFDSICKMYFCIHESRTFKVTTAISSAQSKYLSVLRTSCSLGLRRHLSRSKSLQTQGGHLRSAHLFNSVTGAGYRSVMKAKWPLVGLHLQEGWRTLRSLGGTIVTHSCSAGEGDT